MPYDPNFPPTNAELNSPAFRGQFQGLAALIAAVPAGPQGAQGPPFAQIVIDAVNTLLPGENATVTVSFDGTLVHLTFGIPRGAEGVQGPPGEVTNAQLTTAISGTSNNTNAVPTLDTPFTNDPASLADMETMRAAYNALVLALRR